MRCSERNRDPLLLGLQRKPDRTSIAARTAWKKANFVAKISITLAFVETTQVRAMECIDDDEKSAHDLWNFLESTSTKSN